MCSFFLSPFRARTAEASARSAHRSLLPFIPPRASKNIYFRGFRSCVTRIPNILSYIFSRSLQKRIDPPSPSPRYSNPFPKLFLELEDALCPSRFQSWGAQSLHSAHHRPYCIGVRASAYINKQARVCIGEFLAAPSIVLSERAGERAREPHREALAGRLLLLLLLLFR